MNYIKITIVSTVKLTFAIWLKTFYNSDQMTQASSDIYTIFWHCHSGNLMINYNSQEGR
jgi:hypothetical protein